MTHFFVKNYLYFLWRKLHERSRVQDLFMYISRVYSTSITRKLILFSNHFEKQFLKKSNNSSLYLILTWIWITTRKHDCFVISNSISEMAESICWEPLTCKIKCIGLLTVYFSAILPNWHCCGEVIWNPFKFNQFLSIKESASSYTYWKTWEYEIIHEIAISVRFRFFRKKNILKFLAGLWTTSRETRNRIQVI